MDDCRPLDVVLGGLLVLSFWVRLGFDITGVIALSFVGDILVNHVPFQLGFHYTR